MNSISRYLPANAFRASLPTVLALACILIVLNLISFGFGQAPLATLQRVFEGTWGTPYGIGQVLFKATPLMFTALAFEVAFRAGLFNIGAEGQLALSSLAGAFVAAKLPPNTPMPLALLFSMGAAMAAGALIAFLPAWLKTKLGVHEIISFIMMNRIADILIPWILVALLGAISLRTADVVKGAALLRLDRLFPQLSGSAASIAFFIAVLTLFLVDQWLAKSRAGREMRWIGLNSQASLSEGIPLKKRILQAGLLSGAIAGMGMLATVLGYKGYYELGLGAGAGFSGIAVALLGRGKPFGILGAAILFGTLEQAGLAINATVPKDAMGVLIAVVILAVAISTSVFKVKASPKIPIAPSAEDTERSVLKQGEEDAA